MTFCTQHRTRRRELFATVFILWPISAALHGQPSPSTAARDTELPATPYRREAIVPAAKRPDIHWGPLLREWWLNLCMEHTERILKETKTREALSGPFFSDWFATVTTYHFNRWSDDDKFVTSNLGHPAQGAIVASIFWQNDDRVRCPKRSSVERVMRGTNARAESAQSARRCVEQLDHPLSR